jgi:hypothetical protein
MLPLQAADDAMDQAGANLAGMLHKLDMDGANEAVAISGANGRQASIITDNSSSDKAGSARGLLCFDPVERVEPGHDKWMSCRSWRIAPSLFALYANAARQRL